MGKTFIRIDDRLIHGQIIMAWSKHLDINEIIGVDDKTANNVMLKQIMTMSVPASYKCSVVTLEDAKRLLAEETPHNRLFIVRFASALEELKDVITGVDFINIGNLAKTPESVYNWSSGISIFYLSKNDVRILNELSEKGMTIMFRTTPATQERTWESFMKGVVNSG